MTSCKRQISKEVFDRALINGGHITGADMQQVFTMSELCGYGVYMPTVYKDGDKYMCQFEMGDSCD